MPLPGDRRGAFLVRQLIATFCGLAAVCGGLLALTGITLWLVAAATQVRHGAPAREAFALGTAYVVLGVPLAVFGGLWAAHHDRIARRSR